MRKDQPAAAESQIAGVCLENKTLNFLRLFRAMRRDGLQDSGVRRDLSKRLCCLSGSITVCQARRDHIIITAVAYSRLLNGGKSLVKSDVGVASLSPASAWSGGSLETSPRGREHGMAAGTGAVNNKIYYPLGRPGRGADADCCSLEFSVRLRRGGGIPKRMEEGRHCAMACQLPQSEGEGWRDREHG